MAQTKWPEWIVNNKIEPIGVEIRSLIPQWGADLGAYYRSLIEAGVPESLAADMLRDIHKSLLEQASRPLPTITLNPER